MTETRRTPSTCSIGAGAAPGRVDPAAVGGAPDTEWHSVIAVDVLRRLGTGEQGLDEHERARRLAASGPNALPRRRADPWWEELGESLVEPLQLLLIAVAVLSAVFGELSDAIAIAVVIVVVVVVETVTELRAARAIDALAALGAPTARLVRPDGTAEVPAAALVVGDVIRVEAGDVVPADARVLAGSGLRVDESSLTGEPAAVGKGPGPVEAGTELAERSSVLHSGTAVVGGHGRAVVVATGAGSRLGRLGELVATSHEPDTPLQLALSRLARAVLVVAVSASALVFGVGVLAGQPWKEMLLSGLTVAFATVPEELPILVVVLLAVGGRQLARRGALLRRLRAGETLGAVTVLITDKTGTLTENHLQLAEIVGGPAVLGTALHSRPDDAPGREPIDVALSAAARDAGLVAEGEALAGFAFDPARKLVSRAWGVDGRVRIAVSGAPEAVLERCLCEPERRAEVEARLAELTGRGLRVVAFAERDLPGPPTDRDQAETGLRFVGLVAFTDPLRAGVADAVAALTGAGVSTIMVTGDHPATAIAVAAQAGLPPAQVYTGRDVAALDDDELAASLTHGTVVARATPETKHRLVEVLQHRREIVAVTGDGVNDAPALAAADVGIAMGHRGSDLARSAADLVLTDDAYPTVTAAVAKGRNISAQLRRAVAFYLGAKLALVLVILAALAAGRPVPFAPIHIVLLEIFMDLGASVAFVAEPAAPAAMHRPPRPPGVPFLDTTTVRAIAVVALTLTGVTLPAYLLATTGPADPGGLQVARAAAILAWLGGHALIAWTLRARPALSWASNPAFPVWAGTAILAGAVFTLTPLGGVIGLGILPLTALAAVAVVVAAVVAVAVALNRALRLGERL